MSAEPKAAVFPACFLVNDPDRVGGIALRLNWFVNAPGQTVTGTGQLTQPINPPTDITLEMDGHYEEEGGKIHIVAGGGRPGASIQVAMLLDSWGGSGKADVTWYVNNKFSTIEGIPVSPTPCFE